MGRPTKPIVNEVIEKYNSGWTIRRIAAHFNRNYSTIHRILYNHDVEFRPRGFRSKRAEVTVRVK